MTGLKDWSTSAGSNNSAAPHGFPENMNPSDVNNSAREVMAQVRSWYEDAQWTNLGHTPTYSSSTEFTIAGDKTTVYTVGRRLKFSDSSTLYGTITNSSYSSPNTTVTVVLDSGNLSASLSAVFVGILTPSNTSIPNAFNPNTDFELSIGRVTLGYDDGTDTASFAHYDNSNTTDFAVAQSAAGATKVNAKSGQTVVLGVNDTAVATISGSSVALAQNTSVTGTLSTSGNFAVNINKFNVTAASGNTTIAGTLGVTGASTLAALSATTGSFSSTLAAGNTTITGTASVSSTTTLSGAVTCSTGLSVTGSTITNNGSVIIQNAGSEIFRFSIGTTSQAKMFLQDVEAWRYATVNSTDYGQFTVRDTYTAGFPAYSFLNDTNTGIGNEAGTRDKLNFITGGSVRGYFLTGLTVGSPTGGDKGVGTINAVGVYDDNVLLTCYVPEYVQTGTIDLKFWDDIAGGVHHNAANFLYERSSYLDVSKYTTFWKTRGHLPAFPSKVDYVMNGKLSTGEMINRLWETVEVQAYHISQLLERLEQIERKL